MKEQLYEANKENPTKWTAANLAEEYQISEQRVIAIITLRQLREEQMEKGHPVNLEAARARDDQCRTYSKGVNEEVPPPPDPAPTYSAVQPGQEPEPVSREDLEAERKALEQSKLKCALHFSFALALSPPLYEGIIKFVHARRRFNERLRLNLMRFRGPMRYPGSKRVPPRPEGGYDVVVTPKGSRPGKPFASKPDGSFRELDGTETSFWSMQYPPSFRRKAFGDTDESR